MIAVPDRESLAAMRVISKRIARRCGGSTGTNISACSLLIRELLARGEKGSIVTLLCDSGERYASTYHDAQWMDERMGDLSELETELGELI